ncbi:cobalamin biosynthesis protein CbiG [Hylemonella gracilis]|uniref:cobalamin biosynthesis protein CbiG n=1 Tax=Hylemonella gracilis TaxID=80880 RepID=UPI0012DE5C19|nr:cobalamin biosynthesis protein CbiG [Hylemonella gracilis]
MNKPLFDRYIAVDWSANNGRKQGQDSIWIADSKRETSNPPTRHQAMACLNERLRDALQNDERVLVGLDFAFGYPSGTATLLTGKPSWDALWKLLHAKVCDDENNCNNRFDVANELNKQLGESGPLFWGRPDNEKNLRLRCLNAKKTGIRFEKVREKRAVESLAKGAKSVWQLFYNGSVGSQALLGIAWLEKLRANQDLQGMISIWPFETDFERSIECPVVLAEIYPSLGLVLDPTVAPKDKAQVEAQIGLFTALDKNGLLREALSFPTGVNQSWRKVAIAEEGWIFGVGHEKLQAANQDCRPALES